MGEVVHQQAWLEEDVFKHLTELDLKILIMQLEYVV